MNELTVFGALLVGFLGSSHCLGMCGGLTVALGLGSDGSNQWYLVSYNIGRILMYATIGAFAGWFGSTLVSSAPVIGVVLRVIAGGLLIAMGLYISQLWMGLSRLEKMGAVLWKKVQPLSKKFIPVTEHKQALQLGVLWGLLPCGLVYSTLAWALATADWKQSALFMLAFGIGTLPAMLSVGFIGQKMLSQFREKKYRMISGIVIITMGILTILMPLQHFYTEETQHQHHSQVSGDSDQKKMGVDV